MKKIVFILAAAALGYALPAQAKGDYDAGKAKSTTCAACHGEDGVSSISSFPKLAGQHSDYLYHALKEYKAGKRKNPTMAAQVEALSEVDMRDLAAYFSRQKGLDRKY